MGRFSFSDVLVILALILMGFMFYYMYKTYQPQLYIGACIANKDGRVESWQEKDSSVFIVIQVGKENYRLMYVAPEDMYGVFTERSFRTANRFYEEVKCPGGSK